MLTRQNALNEWLAAQPDLPSYTIEPLAGDASFRRYFRLKTAQAQYIIMDAPPSHEGLVEFIQIGRLMAAHGIHTPQILAANTTQGFALLEDLGDTLLFNGLSSENTHTRYIAALDTLLAIQKCPTDNPKLPLFDIAFMQQEMGLFQTWFLEAFLGITLSRREEQHLASIFQILTTHLTAQPQCFIHRDYHARNLLIVGEKTPLDIGVIDFQDAMRGPFTYDLVSLLKDCYLHWSDEQRTQWMTYFYHQLPQTDGWSLSEFQHGLDWCGLQRHLKVLGIFARLHLRDKKSAYLRDLPLTLHHTMSCLAHYEAFEPLFIFMQQRVLPAFEEKQPA